MSQSAPSPQMVDGQGNPDDLDELSLYFAWVQDRADELQDRVDELEEAVLDFERGLVDQDELVRVAGGRPEGRAPTGVRRGRRMAGPEHNTNLHKQEGDGHDDRTPSGD